MDGGSGMIQTGKELATLCEKIATKYKTSYIWGGIGSPITLPPTSVLAPLLPASLD